MRGCRWRKRNKKMEKDEYGKGGKETVETRRGVYEEGGKKSDSCRLYTCVVQKV